MAQRNNYTRSHIIQQINDFKKPLSVHTQQKSVSARLQRHCFKGREEVTHLQAIIQPEHQSCMCA